MLLRGRQTPVNAQREGEEGETKREKHTFMSVGACETEIKKAR